jgi:transposase
MERRKRRSFTPEFRAEAVRLVREGSKNLPQVAKDLDLTESALRNQVREADGAEGKNPAAGALTGAEREELVRLVSYESSDTPPAGTPAHHPQRAPIRPSRMPDCYSFHISSSLTTGLFR